MLATGMSAGLLATILGSPMDVIATRLMAQQTAKGVPPMGLVPFCASVLRREGILAFWCAPALQHNYISLLWVLWTRQRRLDMTIAAVAEVECPQAQRTIFVNMWLFFAGKALCQILPGSALSTL